jgi:hypothetical protein
MSWRTGSELFGEMWPLIHGKVKPAGLRKEFVRDILAVFLEYDVDPYDLEDVHAEVAGALQQLRKQSGQDSKAEPRTKKKRVK